MGPVRGNASASVGFNYTDNVFYSTQRKNDFMINPEVSLDGMYPISQLNTLRLSLGIGYEWYLKNHALNADAPFINPGTQLELNLFVGDVRIRLHDNFSYQESLFINSFTDGQQFFNFNNVGTFKRLDNKAGFDATWDLEKAVFTAGYDHETFIPFTGSFDYMNRESELFNASGAYKLGDHAQAGAEGQGSWNEYHQETTLNDNWHARVGPFVDLGPWDDVKFRAGGGYDFARYDAIAAPTSDYDSFYAYGKLTQKTRFFSHALEGGRENMLGDNANNMRTTYARYSIDSQIINHVDLAGNVSVNWAEEYGGASGFDEKFIYYDAGAKLGWQFHKHWRAETGYEYLWKDSKLAMRDFFRNRITATIIWQF